MKIQMSPAVASALASGAPVVALESTIIAHGFPRPDNLVLAGELEQEVQTQGATPATIAILDGVAYIGLEKHQLQRVAQDPGVAKASIRDLGAYAATGANAATTVAATAYLASLAGIQVFATGGIGGVHRGASTTMDVSADLRALGRTAIAVVSAGAKAILDLGCTLEVLETEGVPVIGYCSDDFPAFYTRSSGHQVVQRIDSIQTLARLCANHWSIGLTQSVLVCNPIDCADEIPRAQVESWTETALKEAEDKGVKGKALTPFILGRLLSLSGGLTLIANRSLALGNARLAGQLAVALASLEDSTG